MNIVRWMKGHSPISMELMFAMRASAPAYQRDNLLRNQFYAESFVLTHYLQSATGGRAERFDRFLDRLHDGEQPMKAFRSVFPDSEWAPMVAALDRYMDGIEFEDTRRVGLPAITDVDQGALALSPAEALTRLGELDLHLGPERLVEAGEHFDAALTLDPAYALARAGLGIVADRDGRFADAEEAYGRALAGAPADPRVLDVTGRGTLYRLLRRMRAQAPQESLVAIARLARERYGRSLQADPNDLEALGGYGETFALAGDAADSTTVRGLERAVAALPGRSDLATALLVLHAQQELKPER
jgi:Flp pilus assembly protein TadD